MLIIGPGSSLTIRAHLPTVLDRLRGLVQGQPLDDAAVNQDERRALSVVAHHATRAWQVALGELPADDDIRQLLSLIRIQVLDVDDGGAEEYEAKDRLRNAVLHDPEQADTAWTWLITACAHLAARRSGTGRPALQQFLLHVGIDLQAPRSYRDDIERLRAHSQTTLDRLAHLARMQIGATEVKIQRHSTEELRRAAEEDALLVVGVPGAGKSGALHDLVQELRDEGRDVVLLAVDHLVAHSLGDLRQELGINHDFTEILANWPGTTSAFLVIDALDAARAEPAVRTIRDLIRLIVGQQGRWHVVASIRKFDLRYSQELKQLFAGDPPTTHEAFADPEFHSIRHLNVPQLSDEELAQIGHQSPELRQLIDGAPQELCELLRIPFNLRLMAELLGAGIAPADLTPIRTQLELLDRYWSYRVIRSDGQGDAREGVLRRVCEEMVKARALRVDRSYVAEPTLSALLTDLLSTHILTEWQPAEALAPDRYVLTFSHHVLFDYAVERLLLRGTPEALVKRLTDDPELVIVVRPSLVLRFQHLWTADPRRVQFWHLVFQIVRAESIREIGKLIGPAVGAERADTLFDLEPLCAAIESTSQTTASAAEQALRHLIGALLAATPAERSLIGPEAGPWCDLLERVSRHLRVKVADTVCWLLSALCEHPEAFTSAQRASAGKTARRLLEFAWARALREQSLVMPALQAVCRTFDSEPMASAILLRRSLAQAHLANYGFEEMPWLAREVKRLIPLDPVLVEEIYRAVFAHREPSEERTLIGHSQILRFSSNRRQDYEMAYFVLAEAFPEFLVHAPRRATSALVAVMESYVTHHYMQRFGEGIEESFPFGDQEARFCPDYSVSWDASGAYGHEDPLKMLNVFEEHIERLAAQEDSMGEIHELIEVLAQENRRAIFWRRLLFLGTRFPHTLGREILPLARAVPVLTGIDTTAPAGEFLKAVFPGLLPDERERIEQTLLSIPDAYPMDRREGGEHIRNRLLGCLADTDLATDEARHLLMVLQAINAVPPNEPLVQFGEVTSLPFGEEEYLAYEGVQVNEEANRNIRNLEQPVQEFADKHLNSVPTLEEVSAVFPALQVLRTAISHADTAGVHPKQQAYALDSLARACSRIVRMEDFSCEESVGAFIQAVLLNASGHPDPVHNPEYDVHFDKSPSWGSPAVRVETARGLLLLARHTTCATPEVLQAIEHLSIDPVPAVRYQIAIHLNVLYRTAPELMWRLIERLCHGESSRGVLQGLLSGPLGRLAGAHLEQVASLVKATFDRVQGGEGANEVRKLCIDIFTELYIWRDHDMCRNIVLGLMTEQVTSPDDTRNVLSHLRGPLTHGPVDPPDPQQDAIRQRAIDLITRFLHTAKDSLHHMETAYAHVPFNDWPEIEQKNAQSLTQLIDYIGREIYFASGAYGTERHGRTDAQRPFTREEQARFYHEAGHILDALADVGLPSLAHHLLETLEVFIPSDPEGVFLRIGRVIRGGQKGGFQYESLAANLMVRLVEQYLAEYRVILRENEECRRTLLEVLDAFVQVGWPSARRLTYRLEEIFR
jgi:hypothetical protein